MIRLAPDSVALVTGASSGIGQAIAQRLAVQQVPLVLVARSKDRLEALAADWRTRYGGDVHVLPLDLSAAGAVETLFERTEGEGRAVDLLVNNAGFGLNGAFDELPLERTLALLELNVRVFTESCHRFLAPMRARRHGRILNVASTAAFLPVPYMAVYAASKAFVLSLSHALHEEARGDGVTVTALCPGYTRTAFHDVAGMKGAEATPFPEMTAEAVADAGLLALENERALRVTHPLDRLWIACGRLTPRSFPPRLAAFVFRRTPLSSKT
ncbi:MAG: SDR family oxidoreductase [Thermoanaerobaculia bacterium]